MKRMKFLWRRFNWIFVIFLMVVLGVLDAIDRPFSAENCETYGLVVDCS